MHAAIHVNGLRRLLGHNREGSHPGRHKACTLGAPPWIAPAACHGCCAGTLSFSEALVSPPWRLQIVRRPLHYALVDEVDSILIGGRPTLLGRGSVSACLLAAVRSPVPAPQPALSCVLAEFALCTCLQTKPSIRSLLPFPAQAATCDCSRRGGVPPTRQGRNPQGMRTLKHARRPGSKSSGENPTSTVEGSQQGWWQR